jgi:pilus assembly protein CpaE
MGRDLKFIVLNTDEQFSGELRAILSKFDRIKVVAEVDDPALLAPAAGQFPVDVIMVNLDPDPERILPIVADLSTNRRELVVFAASKSVDGQLILKAMRMGVKEFFPRPVESNALSEAIEKISVEKTDAKPSGRLITVTGTSGGVGATMLATNLACELASMGVGKVAAVDLDYRFGQVATFLDITPTYTLADLCSSAEALEPSVIERALTHHPSGVHVLSRPNNFTESEMITGPACMGVVSNLLEMHQFVVTDGPTRFDVGATSVLSLSDVNLLVVQPQVPCVRNATRIVEALRMANHNMDRVRLVCNRVGREAGSLTPDNVAETLGLEVFASIPDEWSAISGAINLGEPLCSHSPKSRVRHSILEIAQRLHKPSADADDKEARSNKKGLIGRIFANT